MKEIKAVIQPQRLRRLRSALRRLPDFPGMTVVSAEGCSQAEGFAAQGDVASELAEFSAKVWIAIVASDECVGEILRVIHQTCHTGQKGDGVAWVTEVTAFLRLRDDPA